MNLIEQLGLEKCQQIVDGAPEEAEQYDLCEEYYISIDDWSDPFFVDDDMCIEIKDLRTAIANHGTPTNEGTDNLSHFDHCTDIRNHISPNTIVLDSDVINFDLYIPMRSK